MSTQPYCEETSASAADIANYVRAELAEGRDVSLTNREATLLMAEYDRRGRAELGHE